MTLFDWLHLFGVWAIMPAFALHIWGVYWLAEFLLAFARD